ncbi:MAG TPA: Dam family site-specific DNA-(adenine-N6)-methyltransferase [Pyrinomonadaceae bacterium]|nr:Dam family site-specific DNA-(adenine-N6)-methyltransferase [Pyrinomonadaceae bacterium]
MPNISELEPISSPAQQLLDEVFFGHSLPPLRPPLKWAGGKRWLVPIMKVYWRGHCLRRFVEAFCGGLAITLALRPTRALLNDINPHLINFYVHLKKGLRITIDVRYSESVYYSNRDRFNELIRSGESHTSEAAQLFYYLNRTCFNGLCRFNQSGEFNVPFGSFAAGVKYATDFLEYSGPINGWQFTNRDFEQLPIEPDDFIYADPPYDVEFTTYSQGGFSWEDQERTAQWLALHPGPVVLCNQATPKIEELYKDYGFFIEYRQAPRRISCDGNRQRVTEVIATRNLMMV